MRKGTSGVRMVAGGEGGTWDARRSLGPVGESMECKEGSNGGGGGTRRVVRG